MSEQPKNTFAPSANAKLLTSTTSQLFSHHSRHPPVQVLQSIGVFKTNQLPSQTVHQPLFNTFLHQHIFYPSTPIDWSTKNIGTSFNDPNQTSYIPSALLQKHPHTPNTLHKTLQSIGVPKTRIYLYLHTINTNNTLLK